MTDTVFALYGKAGRLHPELAKGGTALSPQGVNVCKVARIGNGILAVLFTGKFRQKPMHLLWLLWGSAMFASVAYCSAALPGAC